MKKRLAILATASALAIVPAASASGAPPGGPGGCNMLDASVTGLNQMMAGSQNGSGQNKMFQMLARFPCSG